MFITRLVGSETTRKRQPMSRNRKLDPLEEYVIIPLRVLEKLVRYALAMCQDRCPAERDPEACYYLISLCKILGLGKPPCMESDYAELSEKAFLSIIREIEHKYGMKIQEFLRRARARGPRSLEERTDLMEAEFAFGMLKILSSLRGKSIIIARGSQIEIMEDK